MDTEYLKGAVGDALTQGISAICVKQPDDAVEFLGEFLIAYVETKQKQMEADVLAQKVAAAEATAKVVAEEKRAAAAAADAEAAKLRAEQESFQKQLEEEADVVGQYGALLSKIKSETGASSCYFGRKETKAGGEDGPTWQIQYVASTDSVMKEKTLAAPPTDDDASKDGTGVTFDVWTPIESTDEEGNPVSTPCEYIHINNVIRDERVQFFDVPKLGAYLAVPFKYESYLHPDVFDPVSPDGTEEPPAEGAEPVVKVNTVNVDMVIGVDSMGQGRSFTDEQIAAAQKWALLIGENLTRSEKAVYEAEKVARAAAAEENVKLVEDAPAAKAAAQTEMQTEIDQMLEIESKSAPDGQVDESVKVLNTCEIKTKFAKKAVLEHKERLLQMVGWAIGPKADAIKVLECTLYILGYSQDHLYDMKSGKPDWNKIRSLNFSEFFTKINEYEPIETPATEKYATIDALKALLEGLDEAVLAQRSIIYSTLLDWAKQAIESREESIKKKEADLEAQSS